MKKKRFFITIEGIDGSGKSTQAKLLYNYLKDRYDIIHTREPGGSIVAERIRNIILDPDCKMSPFTELMLYEASRAEHFHKVILPNLKQNKIVLCERFIDSTCAYQGYARGLDIKTINNLNSIVTDYIKPDITLLFDVNPEVSYKRLKNRAGKIDRIELEGINFQKKVRLGYLNLAKKEKKRIKVFNIENKTIEEVHERVIKEIDKLINN